MEFTFQINQGRRCAQSLINCLGVNRSFEELDSLTGKVEDTITSPVQLALGLYLLNIEFVYPIKPLFLKKTSDEIQKMTLSSFGEEISKKINFPFVLNAIERLRAIRKYSDIGEVNLKTISNFINGGFIPLALINSDIFLGKKDKKNGHYILIHEIKNDYARILDTGPFDASPDKRISLRRLRDSLMQTPIDYGIVFVER